MSRRFAAVLLVAFAFGLVVLHALDPQPIGSPLSVFSVGPYGWIYQVSFAAAALALATLASGRTGWARGWLAIAGSGAALAAAFPSGGVAVNVSDRIHLAGSLLFVVATSSVLWFGRPSPAARGLALSGTVLLAMTAALKVQHSSHAGLFQRLLLAVMLVGLLRWLLADDRDRRDLASPRAARAQRNRALRS